MMLRRVGLNLHRSLIALRSPSVTTSSSITLPSRPLPPQPSSSHLPPSSVLLCRSLHSGQVLCKKKGKGRQNKGSNAADLSAQMEEYLEVELFKEAYSAVLEHFRDQIVNSLTLHMTAETVARSMVRADDGQTLAIGHVAKVVQKSPELIIVDLSASMSLKNVVVNALRDLGAGIMNEDSGTLYVSVPKVTKESRMELAKRGKGLMNKTKKEMDQIHAQWAHKLRPKDLARFKFSSNEVFEAKQLQVSVVHEFHRKAEDLWKKREKDILK